MQQSEEEKCESGTQVKGIQSYGTVFLKRSAGDETRSDRYFLLKVGEATQCNCYKYNVRGQQTGTLFPRNAQILPISSE